MRMPNKKKIRTPHEPNIPKRNRTILLPLFAIAFMKIYGHFFATKNLHNAKIKLHLRCTRGEQQIEWLKKRRILLIFFHLFAIHFIAFAFAYSFSDYNTFEDSLIDR